MANHHKFNERNLQSAVVLFLVALPLNLGVAASSGVPAYLGIVSGVIGAVVVGALSGAPLMVSGPDAGIGVLVLEMIQAEGIKNLGPIVMLSGLCQTLVGVAHGAIWFRVFAPSVVNGMLAGMGMIIVLTQLQIMLDSQPRTTGLLNLLALPEVFAKSLTATEGLTHHPAACIGLLTISVALIWPKIAKGYLLKAPPALPAILVAAVATAVMNLPIQLIQISEKSALSLRIVDSNVLASALVSSQIWVCALTLAFVASAQSLLTATAIDSATKSRKASLNRELLAQGIGNIFCGFLGSLPVAGVLLRSMANIHSGATSRSSNIIHGVLILTAVLLMPSMLNKLPVCSLAALLVLIGCKMVQGIFKNVKNYARPELVILVATTTAILCTNLFTGVVIGFTLAAAKELYALAYLGLKLEPAETRDRAILHLRGAATFLQLPRLATILESVPPTTELHVRLDELNYIDHACLELMMDRAEHHRECGGELIMDWGNFQTRDGLVRAGVRNSSIKIVHDAG